MSSFYKKNPMMDRIISSKEFKKDIPESITNAFVKSLLKDKKMNLNDHFTEETLRAEFPMPEYCPFFFVSKNVQRAASQIDVEKVKDIFKLEDLPFERAIISLGSDVDGMYYLQCHTFNSKTFLSFTYLTGSTDKEIMANRQIGNIVSSPIEFIHSNEKSAKFVSTMFLFKLLVYMHYGDIITKEYGKKDKIITDSRGTITNTTDYNITYVNTLWKQRVSTVGFQVTGHWRMQPFGTRSNSKYRLLWIEEFEKDGYNRKATKETLYGN